ncbi:hypothetical protein ACFL51_00200 [Myxococcota bacterium]
MAPTRNHAARVNLAAALALASLGALSTASCRSRNRKVSCERLYTRQVECASGRYRKANKASKSRFVASCKKDNRKQPANKLALKCLNKSSCAAFKKCLKKANEAVTVDTMRRTLKNGKWTDKAWLSCATSPFKDQHKTLCEKVLAAAYEHYRAKVSAARDKSVTARDRPSAAGCEDGIDNDLNDVASLIGWTKKAAAKKLCNQVRLSQRAFDAIDAAQIRLSVLTGKPRKKRSGKLRSSMASKSGKDRLRQILQKERSAQRRELATRPSGKGGAPDSCYTVDDELAKETESWAAPHRKALHDHCFVALGRVILGRAVFANQCPPGARKLYRRLSRYRLLKSLQDSLLARAKPLCEAPIPAGSDATSAKRPR